MEKNKKQSVKQNKEKTMKKVMLLLMTGMIVMLTCGCSDQNAKDKYQNLNIVDEAQPGEEPLSAEVNTTGEENSTDNENTDNATSEDVSASETVGDSDGSLTDASYPYDVYPYDIATDRQTYNMDKTDIVVGDRLYMTQINDWFTNFKDYEGKTVEIEGYYMMFDKYMFVGRLGPSCPYCTGGYVNFEFVTDDDLSDFESEGTWIQVKGILRRGAMYQAADQNPQEFYYIEALEVNKMEQVGIDTVTD